MTGHALCPHNDLQETPLGRADFMWFTDGSQSANSKYRAGYTVIAPFEVEEDSSPLAELHALTSACIQAKAKTANMCADRIMPSKQRMILGAMSLPYHF